MQLLLYERTFCRGWRTNSIGLENTFYLERAVERLLYENISLYENTFYRGWRTHSTWRELERAAERLHCRRERLTHQPISEHILYQNTFYIRTLSISAHLLYENTIGAAAPPRTPSRWFPSLRAVAGKRERGGEVGGVGVYLRTEG